MSNEPDDLKDCGPDTLRRLVLEERGQRQLAEAKAKNFELLFARLIRHVPAWLYDLIEIGKIFLPNWNNIADGVMTKMDKKQEERT